MHEERPSNANVTVIFLDRAGREVSLARVFTLACSLSIALCTGFCTACACVFTRDTVLAAAPLHALHPGVLAYLFGDPGFSIGLRGREVSCASVFYLACALYSTLCSAFCSVYARAVARTRVLAVTLLHALHQGGGDALISQYLGPQARQRPGPGLL